MCSMKRNKKQEIHPRIICCHTLNATEGRLEPGYIGYGTEWLYHRTFFPLFFEIVLEQSIKLRNCVGDHHRATGDLADGGEVPNARCIRLIL